MSKTATAESRQGRTSETSDVGAAYAKTAQYFDDFSAVDQRWSRRNATYHSLSSASPGSSCPRGTACSRSAPGMAICLPRSSLRRESASTSVRRWSSLRGVTTRRSTFGSQKAGRWTSGEPSTTSFSPTSSRTCTTCSGSSRTSPCTRTGGHGWLSTLTIQSGARFSGSRSACV